MAIKLINKNELVFRNGYFYCDNERVAIDGIVVNQFNEFEEIIQKYNYLEKQGDYHSMPTLDGFEREHISPIEINVEAPTPVLDMEIAKTKAMLSEIDGQSMAEEITRVANHYKEMLYWIGSETIDVRDNNFFDEFRVDTPLLGDPLELTKDVIMEYITHMVTDGQAVAIEKKEDGDDETLEA